MDPSLFSYHDYGDDEPPVDAPLEFTPEDQSRAWYLLVIVGTFAMFFAVWLDQARDVARPLLALLVGGGLLLFLGALRRLRQAASGAKPFTGRIVR